jgi:hypothetical protein
MTRDNGTNLTYASAHLSMLTFRQKQKQDINALQTIVKRLSEGAKMCLSL